MTNFLPVTVIIPTKNEALNIEKCLKSVRNFSEVHVIDLNSTDETREIATVYGSKVTIFDFVPPHPKKRQWALDNLDFENEWILLLDADEEVTAELELEISNAIGGNKDAYFIQKQFHFLGKKLEYGGFSHSAVLLFRRGKFAFERFDTKTFSALDMEVHERALVSGETGRLRHKLKHNDFKGVTAYIDRHNSYSSWEAEVRLQLLNDTNDDLVLAGKLFGNPQEVRRFLKKIVIRLPFEAQVWWAYHYLLRLGFLDGYRGLQAARIRADYISNCRLKTRELKGDFR